MSKKKILLVEDDRMIGSMYKMQLAQDDYDVVWVENGGDVLDAAKKEKPDVILLDVILPQADGFYLLEELRKKKSFKNTPIIMLTSLGTTEDKEKGKEKGATDYLVKPDLTPSQISTIIEKYLK